MTTKVNYDALPNVFGKTGFITITELATEFNKSAAEVSKLLKTAEVKPAGKIPNLKDGKPTVGKPTFAFDANEARNGLSKVIGTEITEAA